MLIDATRSDDEARVNSATVRPPCGSLVGCTPSRAGGHHVVRSEPLRPEVSWRWLCCSLHGLPARRETFISSRVPAAVTTSSSTSGERSCDSAIGWWREARSWMRPRKRRSASSRWTVSSSRRSPTSQAVLRASIGAATCCSSRRVTSSSRVSTPTAQVYRCLHVRGAGWDGGLRERDGRRDADRFRRGNRVRDQPDVTVVPPFESRHGCHVSGLIVNPRCPGRRQAPIRERDRQAPPEALVEDIDHGKVYMIYASD